MSGREEVERLAKANIPEHGEAPFVENLDFQAGRYVLEVFEGGGHSYSRIYPDDTVYDGLELPGLNDLFERIRAQGEERFDAEFPDEEDM